MRWMLDTDTCSYILRERPASVLARFRTIDRDDLGVSEIVAAELLYGARRHPTRSHEIQQDVEDFLSRLVVLPWRGASEYARIRHELESSGQPIGSMDMLIGAHAIAEGATLVTNNLTHLGRITGLRCETWVSPSS